MPIVVTGVAGFIGSHVAAHLLERGEAVHGVDNLNAYYDPALKEARLERLAPMGAFSFEKLDVADTEGMASMFRAHRPQNVIHLAAQAGVRHSLTHPHDYIQANLVGFQNILEGCRHSGVSHLLYASSSSVYGGETRLPFSESFHCAHPVSLYAATKKANEAMAHSYSHLYDLPTTGLRFFTVYGPWGRPDMALYKFTQAILAGEPIDLYNRGEMRRDFTYIDDIVQGIVGLLDAGPPTRRDGPLPPDSAEALAPWRVYNVGCGTAVPLLEFVEALEDALGQKAKRHLMPMQPGDVPATWADIERLKQATGYAPTVGVREGVRRFVAWYLAQHPPS